MPFFPDPLFLPAYFYIAEPSISPTSTSLIQASKYCLRSDHEQPINHICEICESVFGKEFYNSLNFLTFSL